MCVCHIVVYLQGGYKATSFLPPQCVFLKNCSVLTILPRKQGRPRDAPKCGGWSCGVSANEDSCAHGTYINFGDLTPYLTYAHKRLHCTRSCYCVEAVNLNDFSSGLGAALFLCAAPSGLHPTAQALSGQFYP